MPRLPSRPGALLAATALLLASGPAAAQTAVGALAAEVSETETTASVQDLVAFGTRYSGTAGCDDAAAYLHQRLLDFGLDARLEGFFDGGEPRFNVSARLPGLVRPDEVFVVMAHYDSTSETPLTFAPGADDNASGVAVVLEAARVMAGHRFEATVEFLLTGAEEQGLLGSEFDAQEAAAAGENLAGIVNLDMVAYWPTGWNRDLDVSGNVESAWLVDLYVAVAAEHVPDMATDGRYDTGVCWDDHTSYWPHGYPAIILMDCYESHMRLEGETTPHYHRTSDTIDTCDLGRLAEVARATTAVMAQMAVPIERTLLREDGLGAPATAHGVLREGDAGGGALTRIDPARGTVTSRFNPPDPTVIPGDGEAAGAAALVFYETDRDERLDLARRDDDLDGAVDLVVTFGP